MTQQEFKDIFVMALMEDTPVMPSNVAKSVSDIVCGVWLSNKTEFGHDTKLPNAQVLLAGMLGVEPTLSSLRAAYKACVPNKTTNGGFSR